MEPERLFEQKENETERGTVSRTAGQPPLSDWRPRPALSQGAAHCAADFPQSHCCAP